ncbi:MAG: hypothetical protein HQ541_16655, partial [Mariniphaga sp.]|nr:hypothetical protein [Mariniphaga sp.]
FYFFSKRFIQNRNKAIIATVILAMVPCYLSHFIWAHSLVITLFLVSLYCLVKINDDKKWIYPLIFVISGITLTQPSQPIKYLIMFMIYILIKSLYDGKFKIKEFIAIIAGYMLSLFWWAANFKGQIMTKSVAAASKEEILGGPLIKFWHIVQTRFSPTSGSATRAYTFNDFFVAKSQNMINNPIGIGIIISLLAILTIFLIIFTYKSMKKEKKSWIIITALWLVFTFLGVNSMTFNLPVGLFAFRFWMLFAIPLSIIAAEGFWFLTKLFKEIKMPRVITISLLILLIFLTSGQQKYTVNTANWGPGQMWTSMEEIQGYTWLKTLPVDTKVFAYSSDEQVIGYDKLSCKWCDEVIEFRKGLLYRNESEVYTWLKKQRYEYLIMDGMAYKSHQEEYGNETKPLIDQRLAEISSSSKFQVVHQTQGVIIFKII